MRPFKFIHAGDIHLGNRMYDHDERFKDFGRALEWLLNYAQTQKVDFVLISGDFFNKSDIKPETFSQAYKILSEFKANCNPPIPLIMIEGNHDSKPYNTLRSWMQLLADMKLIIYLDGKEDPETHSYSFPDFDAKSGRGGKIKIGDAVIYGIRYMGLSISEYLPKLVDVIPNSEEIFNILMLHVGINGMEENKIGIDVDDNVVKIKKNIDYMALGHFHKKYILNDWIYNAGSLESNSIKEYNYLTDKIRGILLVEVTGKDPQERIVTLVKPVNRAFIIKTFYIGHFESYPKAYEYIISTLKTTLPINTHPKPSSDVEKPIVIIYLSGDIVFPKSEIQPTLIEQYIMEHYDVLLAKVENNTQIKSKKLTMNADPDAPFQEIEKLTFEMLIKANSYYASASNEILQLMDELKPIVINKIPDPEDFLTTVAKWLDVNTSKFTPVKNPLEKQPGTEEIDSATSKPTTDQTPSDNSEQSTTPATGATKKKKTRTKTTALDDLMKKN